MDSIVVVWWKADTLQMFRKEKQPALRWNQIIHISAQDISNDSGFVRLLYFICWKLQSTAFDLNEYYQKQYATVLKDYMTFI